MTAKQRHITPCLRSMEAVSERQVAVGMQQGSNEHWQPEFVAREDRLNDFVPHDQSKE